MKFKRKPIKQMSDKGKIRREIGKLHLEILRLKRGNKCEICGKSCITGRFHIIRVSKMPRIEFHDRNVLLSCWKPCHFLWHHAGANDEKCMEIEAKIKELRGDTYKDELKIINAIAPKMTEVQLYIIREAMRQELAVLKGE